MISAETDPVKQQIAAHWNQRAAHFDKDFGHSICTSAERAAWDRILDLILPAAGALEALDIGNVVGRQVGVNLRAGSPVVGEVGARNQVRT